MSSIITRRLALAAALATVAMAAPAAAADNVKKVAAADIEIPPPPAGKGQVVFFRPGAYVGGATSFSVHEGDKGVGKLSNGSYFILTPEPGVHEYTIQFEAKDSLRMEIEAGETYYVQQTIGMGIVASRPHLTPTDKAAFVALKHMKLSSKVATDLKPKAEKPAK